MIRDTCRDFADEKMVPFAGEWDKTHTFPTEAIQVRTIPHPTVNLNIGSDRDVRQICK